MIGSNNFWTLQVPQHSSWIWKAICKLRPIARQFVVCEIGSGITASFWKDSWTPLGPLIEITGLEGPQVTGLANEMTVADSIRDGKSWLSSMRTRNPVVQLLRQCLPSA